MKACSLLSLYLSLSLSLSLSLYKGEVWLDFSRITCGRRIELRWRYTLLRTNTIFFFSLWHTHISSGQRWLGIICIPSLLVNVLYRFYITQSNDFRKQRFEIFLIEKWNHSSIAVALCPNTSHTAEFAPVCTIYHNTPFGFWRSF